MTRPAGTTPRGLPFPGSAGAHANTPEALQALATAVTNQLTSVAGGLELRFFSGNVVLNSVSAGKITWPNFTIYGGLCQLSSHLGGTGRIGFASRLFSGGDFHVYSVNGGVLAAGNETFNGDTVTICAVAWGTPV